MIRPSIFIRFLSLLIFKEKGTKKNIFGSLITENQSKHERSIQVETQTKKILDLIAPWPSISPLVRVGSAGDGGYILNELDRDRTTYLISGGIETNNDFELALAELGVTGIQIDNSISEVPKSHPNLVFKEATVGIESGDFSVKTFLTSLNGQQILLKLDIEGAEWEVIDSLSIAELKLISCLVAEFHFLSKLSQPVFFDKAIQVFSKLRKSGLYPCFISPNNVTGVDMHGGLMIPRNLEITFTKIENINFNSTKEGWILLNQMIAKNRDIYSSINIDHLIFHNYLR